MLCVAAAAELAGCHGDEDASEILILMTESDADCSAAVGRRCLLLFYSHGSTS